MLSGELGASLPHLPSSMTGRQLPGNCGTSPPFGLIKQRLEFLLVLLLFNFRVFALNHFQDSRAAFFIERWFHRLDEHRFQSVDEAAPVKSAFFFGYGIP